MHDTNTDANDMCWTELGCNNAVIEPRVCFMGAPSTAKRWTQPSRHWALRHDLKGTNTHICQDLKYQMEVSFREVSHEIPSRRLPRKAVNETSPQGPINLSTKDRYKMVPMKSVLVGSNFTQLSPLKWTNTPICKDFNYPLEVSFREAFHEMPPRTSVMKLFPNQWTNTTIWPDRKCPWLMVFISDVEYYDVRRLIPLHQVKWVNILCSNHQNFFSSWLVELQDLHDFDQIE